MDRYHINYQAVDKSSRSIKLNKIQNDRILDQSHSATLKWVKIDDRQGHGGRMELKAMDLSLRKHYKEQNQKQGCCNRVIRSLTKQQYFEDKIQRQIKRNHLKQSFAVINESNDEKESPKKMRAFNETLRSSKDLDPLVQQIL